MNDEKNYCLFNSKRGKIYLEIVEICLILNSCRIQ